MNSSQNKEYLKKFESEFPTFFIYAINEEQKLFKKSLNFKAYILLMNGRKFQFFIDYLLSNSINSISISAVFTSNTTSLKDKIDIKYKQYLEDAFYNPLGISDTILDLLKSMKDFIQELEMK